MKVRGLVPVLLLSAICCAGEVRQREVSLTAASPEMIRQAEETAQAAKQEKQQQTAAEKKVEVPQKKSGWFNMRIMQFVPFLLIGVMIFLMFRANKKQQKQHQEMLDKIVKGSKVMLNSGIFGKVSEVREKEFLVEIADNVKVLVLRDAVTLIEEETEVKK